MAVEQLVGDVALLAELPHSRAIPAPPAPGLSTGTAQDVRRKHDVGRVRRSVRCKHGSSTEGRPHSEGRVLHVLLQDLHGETPQIVHRTSVCTRRYRNAEEPAQQLIKGNVSVALSRQ